MLNTHNFKSLQCLNIHSEFQMFYFKTPSDNAEKLLCLWKPSGLIAGRIVCLCCRHINHRRLEKKKTENNVLGGPWSMHCTDKKQLYEKSKKTYSGFYLEFIKIKTSLAWKSLTFFLIFNGKALIGITAIHCFLLQRIIRYTKSAWGMNNSGPYSVFLLI